MSLLNVGLQVVGLMRSAMTPEMEKMSSANSMAQIREAAGKAPGLKEAIRTSLGQPITLLSDVFTRLSLHKKNLDLSRCHCQN